MANSEWRSLIAISVVIMDVCKEPTGAYAQILIADEMAMSKNNVLESITQLMTNVE